MTIAIASSMPLYLASSPLMDATPRRLPFFKADFEEKMVGKKTTGTNQVCIVCWPCVCMYYVRERLSKCVYVRAMPATSFPSPFWRFLLMPPSLSTANLCCDILNTITRITWDSPRFPIFQMADDDEETLRTAIEKTIVYSPRHIATEQAAPERHGRLERRQTFGRALKAFISKLKRLQLPSSVLTLLVLCL